MNSSGKKNEPRQYAVDPQTFRAKATGIGQSQAMSQRTGAARAQRVIDSVPAHCRGAIPPSEGYPAPTPTDMPTAIYTGY